MRGIKRSRSASRICSPATDKRQRAAAALGKAPSRKKGQAVRSDSKSVSSAGSTMPASGVPHSKHSKQ